LFYKSVIMNIGIVDDHEIFRDGLKTLLPPDEMKITLEAENGIDMIDKLKTIQKEKIPDVLLVDIKMPVMDGYETVDWLLSHFPQINIIALTMFDNEDSILRMVKLGVKSYLTKNVNRKELLTAIRTVNDGHHYFTDKVTRFIVQSVQQQIKSTNSEIKINDLSEKEIKFLKLVCTEKTYSEIAAEMQLSLRTIDGYRESLFTKLNVKSRTGLVLFASKNQLVST